MSGGHCLFRAVQGPSWINIMKPEAVSMELDGALQPANSCYAGLYYHDLVMKTDGMFVFSAS